MALISAIRNKSSLVLTAQNVFRKNASTRAPTAVFVEKFLEDPVVVVKEEDYVDIIGPPDALSNLRPVIRKQLLNETGLQKKLREMQDATQAWNQHFWAKHNNNFLKERQLFIDQHQTSVEQRQLTADEMSEFYKMFLDKNWKVHVDYNFEWYKKNFTILFLALRVCLEKSFIRVA